MTENELSIQQEIQDEVDSQHPVAMRFRYAYFTSKSKGKGRKRRHWEEVELINDRYTDIYRWISWDKFPFDEKAGETYQGQYETDEEREQLMNDIPRYAKR